MAIDIAKLSEAIEAATGVELHGVAVPDVGNKQTWAIDWKSPPDAPTAAAAQAVIDGWSFPTPLDEAIKVYASYWINKVLKDDKTQRNMISYSVSLTRKEARGDQTVKDTLDLLDNAQTWVQAVLTFSRAQRQAANADYKNAAWPQPPAGLAALVDQL